MYEEKLFVDFTRCLLKSINGNCWQSDAPEELYSHPALQDLMIDVFIAEPENTLCSSSGLLAPESSKTSVEHLLLWK